MGSQIIDVDDEFDDLLELFNHLKMRIFIERQRHRIFGSMFDNEIKHPRHYLIFGSNFELASVTRVPMVQLKLQQNIKCDIKSAFVAQVPIIDQRTKATFSKEKKQKIHIQQKNYKRPKSNIGKHKKSFR